MAMPISIPRRECMSSTALFLCVLFAAVPFGGTLCAETRGVESFPDWESFVKASDRTDDPVIIDLLTGYDLQTALTVLAALGRRDDPYVGDVLEALASGRGTKSGAPREYLLRILIEGLLGGIRPSAADSSRIEANRESLDSLVKGLNLMTDPQLQGDLVRVMDLLGGGYAPVVAEALSVSIQSMREAGGNLSPMRTELLLTLLSYVSRHPSPDYLGMCVDVAELSRDERAVQSARSVSRSIAAATH
jgi:hypothetical protein